jgi:hypothetical protein
MKATVLVLGVALGAFVAVSPARAQPCYCPVQPAPWNPYASAFYAPNSYGQWTGPNYYLAPPFAPFQGMVFPPSRPCPPGMPGYGGNGYGNGFGGNGFGGQVAFPSHQWARSPRDFFMYESER